MQSSHISQLQLREEQNHKHSFCKGRRPSFISQGPRMVCVTSSPRQNTEMGLIQTTCTFPSGRSSKRSNEPKHALRFWFLLGKSYPPKKTCSIYKVCWLISCLSQVKSSLCTAVTCDITSFVDYTSRSRIFLFAREKLWRWSWLLRVSLSCTALAFPCHQTVKWQSSCLFLHGSASP